VEPQATGWTAASIHEIVHRTTYKGEEVWAKKRNGRTKKVRLDNDPSAWRRRACPAIVTQEIWDAAHRSLAGRAFKAKDDGFTGKAESFKGAYLLSALLECGVCGGKLIATRRGKNAKTVYVCSRRKVHACENTSGVPLDLLHYAVVGSLKKSLSPEALEAYLASSRTDEAKERRGAERAGSIEKQLPALIKDAERLVKRLAKEDDEALADMVHAELKIAVQARKAAEARLLDLESADVEVQDSEATVEYVTSTV